MHVIVTSLLDYSVMMDHTIELQPDGEPSKVTVKVTFTIAVMANFSLLD